jgi:iron complex outermembrane receptor protein
MENRDGNRQIFTPRYTSMLALQYTYAVDGANGLRIFVRGEWMALGKQYFDLANKIEQDAYNLLNARVGGSFKGYELAFWMRNITDERYISYAYDFGGLHLGAPVNQGITIRKNFSF